MCVYVICVYVYIYIYIYIYIYMCVLFIVISGQLYHLDIFSFMLPKMNFKEKHAYRKTDKFKSLYV